MLQASIDQPTFLAQVVPLQAVLEPFFSVLADPNIAYVLLLLGFLGLFLELSTPGTTIPGTLGVIFLILAAVSLSQLPFDWRGATLILIAFVLLLADIFVPSLGLLTLGGLALMVSGSYVLFDESQGVMVSRPLIWAFTVALVILFAVIGGFAVAVLRRKPATGREGMVGAVGTVRTALNPDGLIFVHGEIWQATAAGESPASMPPIEERIPVTVTGMDGLRLIVRRSTAQEADDAGVVVMGDLRPLPTEQDLAPAHTP